MKKKKYIVDCSEEVFYEIEVEAKDEAEVRDLIVGGQVIIPEAHDSQNFSIDNIFEIPCKEIRKTKKEALEDAKKLKCQNSL
jgi:hypothetical protein